MQFSSARLFPPCADGESGRAELSCRGHLISYSEQEHPFPKIKVILKYVCACVSVWGHKTMSAVPEEARRLLGPLELMLEMAVSHHESAGN